MYQFIESIKYEAGKIFHLDWHQKRVNETFTNFFPKANPWHLSEIIQIPLDITSEIHKIRIVYNSKHYEVEFQKYDRKKIKSFELVPIDFDYAFKFEDRKFIDVIKSQSQADEVIFARDNFLLDSSYSNLALYDGSEWLTPSTYLLNGTTRQRLLSENKLKEIPLTVDDIEKFEKISFINALNDVGENVLVL